MDEKTKLLSLFSNSTFSTAAQDVVLKCKSSDNSLIFA